jgi:phosphoribosyl-ATP pyrophosphohydrolase
VETLQTGRRKTGKKNEAIHIKAPQNADPKTFAEVMKNIRKGIDAQQMGVLIVDARTERAGGAKIKLIEKKGAAKELITKIKNIAGNETTVKKLDEKQVAIIIRDLEKTIDRDEIEKAIKDELEVKDSTTCVKVLGPRAPADGEGPNTTLAVMPARWGEMLCYRCQEFGHASYACKSNENRAQKCLNCGEEEHEAKDYEGEEACYICNGGLRTSLANRGIKMNETNKTENTKTGKTCQPVLLGGDRDKKKKQNSPLRDKDEGGKQRKTVLTKLKENAEEMVSFAQANKNVHREVKSLASEIKGLVYSVRVEYNEEHQKRREAEGEFGRGK